MSDRISPKASGDTSSRGKSRHSYDTSEDFTGMMKSTAAAVVELDLTDLAEIELPRGYGRD